MIYTYIKVLGNKRQFIIPSMNWDSDKSNPD